MKEDRKRTKQRGWGERSQRGRKRAWSPPDHIGLCYQNKPKGILFYTHVNLTVEILCEAGEGWRRCHVEQVGAYFRVGYSSLHTLPPPSTPLHPPPPPRLSTSSADRGHLAGCPSSCGCIQPTSMWLTLIPRGPGDQEGNRSPKT